MLSSFVVLSLVAVIIWLVFLSFFLWKLLANYDTFTRGVTDKSFKSVFDSLVNDMKTTKKDIDSLRGFCDRIQKDSLFHIQKIGLVRFNPFKDTGGDQSFILSLVDGKDTGVIISGLYSRSGTRWYAKKIVGGKSVEYELSEEEKKALKESGSNKI